MKPDPRNQNLLNDVLAEAAPDDFRQSSLEWTLGLARRRRRIRYAVRTGSVALFLAAAVAGWLLVPVRHGSITARPTPAERRGSDNPVVTIETINDEELLAAFPDRPLALIGPPGQQDLVFLDQPQVTGGEFD